MPLAFTQEDFLVLHVMAFLYAYSYFLLSWLNLHPISSQDLNCRFMCLNLICKGKCKLLLL